MIKYRSKISWGLVGFILIAHIILIILMLIDRVWLGLAIVLGGFVFIAHFFLTTVYIIQNNQLQIKCGLFYNQKIDIDRIQSILKSNNILSAPALSFDRIEIVYEKNKRILISPQESQNFINNLLRINPNIRV